MTAPLIIRPVTCPTRSRGVLRPAPFASALVGQRWVAGRRKPSSDREEATRIVRMASRLRRLPRSAASPSASDLDRNCAAATRTIRRLPLQVFRQRFGYVLDQRAVVHTWSGRPGRTLAPVAAVVASAPAITPRRSTSVSLIVAQGSPPASTGSARLRSAERPGGASAPLCRHRS